MLNAIVVIIALLFLMAVSFILGMVLAYNEIMKNAYKAESVFKLEENEIYKVVDINSYWSWDALAECMNQEGD